ncbi:MAG TPA: hypothetical protein VGD09_11245 [Blastococcus sp.]
MTTPTPGQPRPGRPGGRPAGRRSEPAWVRRSRRGGAPDAPPEAPGGEAPAQAAGVPAQAPAAPTAPTAPAPPQEDPSLFMPMATPPAGEPAPADADEPTADGEALPAWEAAGQAEAARRRIWRIAAAAGSGLVVAALVGTLTWQSLAWHSASSSLSAGRAALPAAAAAAPAILSYQWTQVDKNLANADKYLTPRFRNSYDNSFTKAIKPFVVSNQLNLDSQVVNAGVIEASANRVVVLLFADQLSTSDKPQATGASTPSSLSQERAEFTMLKQHGKWLVDDITRLTVALPAGASPGNAASPSAGASAAPSASAAPAAPAASPSPAAS